jgi:predicted nucleic acid-binding protein
MRIALGYQLSHWDALIVAAALEADCRLLYSEDMQHEQVFDGRVTVKNPFRIT